MGWGVEGAAWVVKWLTRPIRAAQSFRVMVGRQTDWLAD